MSSRFPTGSAVFALIALLAAGGCEREHREYASNAPRTTPPAEAVRVGTLQPGAVMPPTTDPRGQHFERNAYHITQGGRLYRWFNCNGCHATGGGAIGPALMDAQWRYGGSIEQIHASILQGRPNGMPSFAGKIPDDQAWQIAAYVRALSGNVRMDAAPSRRDGMAATPPLTRISEQDPETTDPAAVQAAGQ